MEIVTFQPVDLWIGEVGEGRRGGGEVGRLCEMLHLLQIHIELCREEIPWSSGIEGG